MARELDAKVARVLSDRSIAINLGEESGVQPGNKVIVWRKVEVRDPDSKEVLGSVRLENLRLAVSEVHPQFSLARVESSSPLFGMFKPSKVIVSSDRALDQEQVRLNVGDAVTVFVSETAPAVEGNGGDDGLVNGSEAEPEE
jgi:hypothetical protein